MNFVFLRFRSAPPAAPAYPQLDLPRGAFPARTDFSALQGRRVLAIFDDDNIRISMKEHGRSLRYATLLDRLRASASHVSAHAVLTHEPGDRNRMRYFESRTWQPLGIPREVVVTRRGSEVKSNADMDLCFECGRIFRHDVYDAVLLGSGDGDLCVALARGIRRLSPSTRIATLSVTGCTSGRLSSRPDLFDAALLIGEDITGPLDEV